MSPSSKFASIATIARKAATLSERIHKFLAREGFGSRREIERWIEDGRVRHDGGFYKHGDRVDVGDVVFVDDRRIEVNDVPFNTRVIAYHKKPGEICTRYDPDGRPLVINALPPIADGKWISVGRLDINSTGLLLFTNNGDLANALMHPSSQIEREYLCRVFGSVSEQSLIKLRSGVKSKGETLRFDEIEMLHGKGSNQWYRIVLKQGKYREIRRAWGVVGHQVSRLKRIRYGLIQLDEDLPQGKWVELPQDKTLQLMQSVKIH